MKLKCPECFEIALTKNGKRWVRRNGVRTRVQQYQCQECGRITINPANGQVKEA